MESLTRQLAEDRRHPTEQATRSTTPPSYGHQISQAQGEDISYIHTVHTYIRTFIHT